MNAYQVDIKSKYLVVPINMHSRLKKICFYQNGQLLWDFDAHVDFTTPQFNAYLNVSHLAGSRLEVTASPEIDLDFHFAESLPTDISRGEAFRPMVHFSAKTGWINDPNGLVYVDGSYHMFFQYNPLGSRWGNMTWGHAVSEDLIHWRQLDSALQPDTLGTMFSGSGIIDKKNVSGVGDGKTPPVLLFYTAAGGTSALSACKPHTQCMAYSTDSGMTFKKYAGNPVICHIAADNRDPKVVLCEELGCYILALYLEADVYALMTSDDLIHFRELQRLQLPGDGECPDIYPIGVEDKPGERLWVFSGASDRYLVGRFENRRFAAIQEAKQYFYGPRTSYAAQTFSDLPGRRVKVAWEALHAPESPFENQMSIPCEVSLCRLKDEYRLRTLPVSEFETLRESTLHADTSEGEGIRIPLKRSAYDMEFSVGRGADDFVIRFFGYEFALSPSKNLFKYRDTEMPLSYTGGDISLRIISDVLGCEIFADDGLIYTVAGPTADYGIRYLTVSSADGSRPAPHVKLTLHSLKSCVL